MNGLFISYFLFIHTPYNEILNIKLIKLKFTFVSFNLMNITSAVFVSIDNMYLIVISIIGGTCIYMARIMLVIVESDDVFQFIYRSNKHSSMTPKNL